MPLFDCMTCDCYQPHNREHPDRGGVCHGKPPETHFLGMQGPPQQGPLVGVPQMQPQPVFVHTYTAVGKGDWCAVHPMFQAMRKARPARADAMVMAVPAGKPNVEGVLTDVILPDDAIPLPGEVKPGGKPEKPS